MMTECALVISIFVLSSGPRLNLADTSFKPKIWRIKQTEAWTLAMRVTYTLGLLILCDLSGNWS